MGTSVVRFDLISDIHLEFFQLDNKDRSLISERLLVSKYDHDRPNTLVVAGDICPFTPLTADLVDQFFDKATSLYKRVIYVLGNHDYWDDNLYLGNQSWGQVTGIQPLDGTSVTIDDTIFIGGTLWTNVTNPLIAIQATRGMNDYRYIYKFVDSQKTNISINDTNSENQRVFESIKRVVENSANKRVIVVTHHAPLYQCAQTKQFESGWESLISSYCNDYSDFIIDHPNIIGWCHGHAHTAKSFDFGSTKILANPHGYYKHEPYYIAWKPLLVEI